jgi:hypothetical protein
MLHSGRVTPTEIEQMALGAGFVAVVHKGEVIVSGLGEEGPLAVVSPLPCTNGIGVCVPAVLETGLRDRIVRAFAPKPEESLRTPGPVRFPPAELLNAAPSPRRREAKSAWTAAPAVAPAVSEDSAPRGEHLLAVVAAVGGVGYGAAEPRMDEVDAGPVL